MAGVIQAPAYRALNRRLMLGPADREMTLSALGIGAVAYAFTGSGWLFLVLFLGLTATLSVLSRDDPMKLYHWLYARSQKRLCDPAKTK